ncbi:MAG: hypothetical protein M1826_005645 [Phylliscum demangeonii]|nr:MAG: hypothetical protein M1826_005645 [Phylliscum demangeonii]
MAFFPTALRSITLPLLLLLTPLMELGHASSVFQLVLPHHSAHFADWTTRLPFQGPGYLQVLLRGWRGYQPAGYLNHGGGWIAGDDPAQIGVFDGQRTGKANLITLRTNRQEPCGNEGSDNRPSRITARSTPLLRGPQLAEPPSPEEPPSPPPRLGDRIPAAWASFIPSLKDLSPSGNGIGSGRNIPALTEIWRRSPHRVGRSRETAIYLTKGDLMDLQLQLRWVPLDV